jgi:hypothetical protein
VAVGLVPADVQRVTDNARIIDAAYEKSNIKEMRDRHAIQQASAVIQQAF